MGLPSHHWKIDELEESILATMLSPAIWMITESL
jgi:hypothetical protein